MSTLFSFCESIPSKYVGLKDLAFHFDPFGADFLVWIARGLRLQENFGNLTSIHDETMKAPADSRGSERLCLVQWYHFIIFD